MKNILNSKYYSKKTNSKAVLLGDLAILLIPPVQAIIADAPGMATNLKYWLMAISSISLIVIKFLFKLWKVDPIDSDSPDQKIS